MEHGLSLRAKLCKDVCKDKDEEHGVRYVVVPVQN